MAASQTLAHFKDSELRPFGEYYLQIDNARKLMIPEGETWSEIPVLDGDPARLGPLDFAGVRRALGRVGFYNDVLSRISSDQIERARRMGIAVGAPDGAHLQSICAPLSI